MDPALIDQGNLLKSDWAACSRYDVQYSSKFGNSQQQFTVTDGWCKEYTSKYSKILREMATEILHENNGCGVTAMRTKCEINYSITNKNWNDAHNMQLTKHNTNDDVDARTPTIEWCACIETAHIFVHS